jgi:uncharacterized protein with PIN domain
MVGRLARWLRILGFDVLYSNRYSDDEIIRLAAAENRTVLTRDRGLKVRIAPDDLVFVENDDVDSQVAQVLQRVGTRDFRLFSRCLECNQELRKIDKELAFERVAPYVYLTQDEFAECPSCLRVYWRGTHTTEMTRKLQLWKNITV